MYYVFKQGTIETRVFNKWAGVEAHVATNSGVFEVVFEPTGQRWTIAN